MKVCTSAGLGSLRFSYGKPASRLDPPVWLSRGGKRETREGLSTALEVCKESLVIRLYKVNTMLVPGLESQSPKWTSTVSPTCEDVANKGRTVRMRESAVIDTKNGEET